MSVVGFLDEDSPSGILVLPWRLVGHACRSATLERPDACLHIRSGRSHEVRSCFGSVCSVEADDGDELGI